MQSFEINYFFVLVSALLNTAAALEAATGVAGLGTATGVGGLGAATGVAGLGTATGVGGLGAAADVAGAVVLIGFAGGATAVLALLTASNILGGCIAETVGVAAGVTWGIEAAPAGAVAFFTVSDNFGGIASGVMRTFAGLRLPSKEEGVVLFAAVACCTLFAAVACCTVAAIDCLFEAGPGGGGAGLLIAAAAACLCCSTTLCATLTIEGLGVLLAGGGSPTLFICEPLYPAAGRGSTPAGCLFAMLGIGAGLSLFTLLICEPSAGVGLNDCGPLLYGCWGVY